MYEEPNYADFRSAVDFGINLYFLRREFGNTLIGIFDILEKRLVNLFETKETSYFGRSTPKEGWEDGIRELYNVTPDSWSPYRDLNELEVPVFDVFSMVGKDMFMRLNAAPSETSAPIKTPEYLELEKKMDEFVSQTDLKPAELMKRWVVAGDKLEEMGETLLHGPRIERKAVLEPCYRIISPEPSLSVKPSPGTKWEPREQPYWHELDSEYKSEVTQNLQALHERLKEVMVTV